MLHKCDGNLICWSHFGITLKSLFFIKVTTAIEDWKKFRKKKQKTVQCYVTSFCKALRWPITYMPVYILCRLLCNVSAVFLLFNLHVFLSPQVVSAGNEPSYRGWGLAVHRWILWQELHWLSQHLLTQEVLSEKISSSDRIHFISQHLRFVSHWYCVFVSISEKSDIKMLSDSLSDYDCETCPQEKRYITENFRVYLL